MTTAAPLPIESPSPQPATGLPQTAEKSVYVILRRVVARWSAARVVAVHDDLDEALADLRSFREFDPKNHFGIFVPYPEPPPGKN